MTPAETNGDDPIEILARFARSAGKDAPQGTLIVDGRPPMRFAGWLDLMAIVEQLLEEERADAGAVVPSPPAQEGLEDVR